MDLVWVDSYFSVCIQLSLVHRDNIVIMDLVGRVLQGLIVQPIANQLICAYFIVH